MSNYFCERCGKAIIDSPGNRESVHWCTTKEVIKQLSNL